MTEIRNWTKILFGVCIIVLGIANIRQTQQISRLTENQAVMVEALNTHVNNEAKHEDAQNDNIEMIIQILKEMTFARSV